MLRELDEELLPGIVEREITAMNQAAAERNINRITNPEYREHRAVASGNADQETTSVPGAGFLRPADYRQSLQRDEARFRRY